MTALLLAAAAWAVPVDVCVDYDLSFVDSDVPGSSEDYFASNGTVPARGIRVEVERNDAPYTLHVADADTAGSTPGCAHFDLVGGSTFSVTVKSVATATSTHTASVRNGGAGPSHGALFSYSGSDIVAVAGTYDVTLPVQPHWEALAVAGRALTRNRGGRPSLDLDIYVPFAAQALLFPAACSGSGSCIDGTDLWIVGDDLDRKFRVAHFLGWAILHDMGYDRSTLARNADDSRCRAVDKPLSLGNLEFTATGFAEGYAYWYASTVFNKSDEVDCSFVFWEPSNWDQLELCHEEYEAAVGHVISCEAGPSLPPYETMVPPRNYRQYCHDDRSPLPAGSSTTITAPANTVVPLDVLRFFKVGDYTGMTREGVGDVLAAAVGSVGSPSAFRAALRTEALAQGVPANKWDDAMLTHGLDQ